MKLFLMFLAVAVFSTSSLRAADPRLDGKPYFNNPKTNPTPKGSKARKTEPANSNVEVSTAKSETANDSVSTADVLPEKPHGKFKKQLTVEEQPGFTTR